jgi:hypothetical protein
MKDQDVEETARQICISPIKRGQAYADDQGALRGLFYVDSPLGRLWFDYRLQDVNLKTECKIIIDNFGAGDSGRDGINPTRLKFDVRLVNPIQAHLNEFFLGQDAWNKLGFRGANGRVREVEFADGWILTKAHEGDDFGRTH